MNMRPDLIPPTPEEDTAITAAALSDPDNPPLTDQQLARMHPMRGRPRLARPKVALTMRVDADVMDALKRAGRAGKRGSTACCAMRWR